MFIARQPIFNKEKQIYGYELSLGADFDFKASGDALTTGDNPIDALFSPFKPADILDNKPVLINFTERMILEKVPLLFPKDQIIIAFPDDIKSRENIISALSIFNDEGYTIALNNADCKKIPDALIHKNKIIKFNLRSTSINLLLESIEAVRSKPDIQLMAENVEIYDDFKMAQSLGFTLFQGFFFSTPETLFSRSVAPNQITTLKLINEVEKKELDYTKIEMLIKNDAPLSFRLLKYINSAYFKRRVTIDTIKDAIAYLGEEELRKFIHVVAVSSIGENKPNELVRTSITRASMCEKCSTLFNTDFDKDELFMLGLFSLMDALMDCRVKDILEHINFSTKMKKALLGRDETFKILLDIIVEFERGRWEKSIFKEISDPAIETKLIANYFESVKSANAFYGK